MTHPPAPAFAIATALATLLLLTACTESRRADTAAPASVTSAPGSPCGLVTATTLAELGLPDGFVDPGEPGSPSDEPSCRYVQLGWAFEPQSEPHIAVTVGASQPVATRSVAVAVGDIEGLLDYQQFRTVWGEDSGSTCRVAVGMDRGSQLTVSSEFLVDAPSIPQDEQCAPVLAMATDAARNLDIRPRAAVTQPTPAGSSGSTTTAAPDEQQYLLDLAGYGVITPDATGVDLDVGSGEVVQVDAVELGYRVCDRWASGETDTASTYSAVRDDVEIEIGDRETAAYIVDAGTRNLCPAHVGLLEPIG